LIISNKTTIEYKEKTNLINSNLKYNLGIFRNLQEVLGNNILIWWIPYTNNNELNGYRYDISGEFNFDYFNKREESRNFYTSQNSQSYYTQMKSDKSGDSNIDIEIKD
jgi:hypothetical protein